MNLKKILQLGINHNASDLHFVCGLSPFFRIDGELYSLEEILEANKEGHDFKGKENHEDFMEQEIASEEGVRSHKITEKDLEKIVEEILSEPQKEKFIREKDIDFGYTMNGYRFRGNLSYERGNMKLVFRIISNQNPTLEEVGMPPIVYKLLSLSQGLILVTGPTGSGKSTSLAAMINYLNENYRYNIVTLEDPVEFIFNSNKSIITQRQLHDDMSSFSEGLKHVFRQDPDVIMVGEMRDLETISTAITLAETGHLVLSTLHTYNASQTVDRIIDIFPPHQQSQIRTQLSLTLSAVISQRLVKKRGGGRIAAREIMIKNSATSNLIREQKTAQIKNIIETSYRDGMVSLSRSIKDLNKEGLIDDETLEEEMNDISLM